jgi:hypothetical protein
LALVSGRLSLGLTNAAGLESCGSGFKIVGRGDGPTDGLGWNNGGGWGVRIYGHGRFCHGWGREDEGHIGGKGLVGGLVCLRGVGDWRFLGEWSDQGIRQSILGLRVENGGIG